MALNHASLEVEGLTELRQGLRRAGDKDLQKALTKANKTAAQIVVDAALPNVPVRSGRLRSSVKALASQTAGRARAGSPARVPYAAAIHWGEGRGNINASSGSTFGRPERNIVGRPFLWQAADATVGEVTEAYAAEIEQLLDEAVRNR